MNLKIVLSRMRKSYFFIIGAFLLVFLVLICYIGPLFLPWDYQTNVLSDRFMAPEWFSRGLEGHILGTDSLGRDILTRILIGGQNSFRISLVAVILTAVIGVVLGLISGYYGGWVDSVIMRLVDVLQALPTLILAIAVIAILGNSEPVLLAVMIFSGWAMSCKIVRNTVKVVMHQEFISASKVLGASPTHIMFRQVFPNTTTYIIISTSQRLGTMIMLEAALSFLQVGIMPPKPSWGNMISSGRQYLLTQPWMIIWPGIVLSLAILAFCFLGDGVRDVLDTKLKV